MTHSDPYGLTGATAGPGASPSAGKRPGAVRTLLWLVLVVSTVGNMVASAVGAGVVAHLACGAVTACCVTLLVVQRVRGRR